MALIYSQLLGEHSKIGRIEMETVPCTYCCGSAGTTALKHPLSISFRQQHHLNLPPPSICLFTHQSLTTGKFLLSIRSSSSSSSSKPTITRRRTRIRGRTRNNKLNIERSNTDSPSTRVVERVGDLAKDSDSKPQKQQPVSISGLHQNGDPLGWRDLGKSVVKWISQGMRVMASEFASAEIQGEFSELRQRMGPGLTFVIQAQPYLNAIPIPLGMEGICLKACTHYPTLFDNFQRELRDVLQDLERQSVVENWRETESWKLLKELATSGSTSSYSILFFFLSYPLILHLTSCLLLIVLTYKL